MNKLLLLLILSLFILSCSEKDEKNRPNIIFIMSDDHAYQAISAYGHGLNETPNIDRIAEEGAIFTRACVSNSICAPSRAVLLTGKHSFVNGKIDNRNPYNWDQDNFAKQLQKGGYQTALIGKIHLNGLPQGFDYSMVLPGQGRYYNPDFLINGESKRFEGYCTDIITDSTLDWLKNKRNPEKPFCVIYNQKAPHGNWKPAPEYYTLYDDVTFEPPANFFDNYEGRGRAAKEQNSMIDGSMKWGRHFKLLTDPDGNPTGFERELERFNEKQKADWLAYYTPKNDTLRAAKLTGKELAKWKFNRYIKDYLKTIKSVDDGVGEVLDYLEEAGLAENTIVVYTSDQGFFLGEHGWYDKRFMYEEAFRTPLLVRYPKEIKPGTKIDKLVQNIDFAPTLLDYADVDIPEDIQGESFRKLVNGEINDWRDAVYYTYYEHPSSHQIKRHYGIATERYKLIHFYYDIDEWEMYDLKTDPSEMKSIYGDPTYSEVQEKLHIKLEELRLYYGDSDENNMKFLESVLNNEIK
ncbi:MAG: sulfatase [Draconibacterium sp.]|nr:sulfatase [Draconibacterium sp.]